jgi:hypothetical protein
MQKSSYAIYPCQYRSLINAGAIIHDTTKKHLKFTTPQSHAIIPKAGDHDKDSLDWCVRNESGYVVCLSLHRSGKDELYHYH